MVIARRGSLELILDRISVLLSPSPIFSYFLNADRDDYARRLRTHPALRLSLPSLPALEFLKSLLALPMGCLQAHPHPPLQRCDGRVREGPQPTKFTPKRPNRPPPPPPPPSPPPASSRAHNRNRGKRHRTDATTPANKKQKQEHENESEQAQQPLPTQQGTNVKDKEDVFDGEFGLARERLLEVVDPAVRAIVNFQLVD